MSDSIDRGSAIPNHGSQRNCKVWLLFLLPYGLLLGVLLFSPNFHWLDYSPDGPPPFRENPYGGDFLQDWVGGKIASIPIERECLYLTDYARQIQHTPSVVGFAWPKEKYFPMVYPPYHYLLVSPLSMLPYRWATLVWALLSASALTLTGWLLYRFYQPIRNRSGLMMLGMVGFAPTIVSLSMGQKSTWMLLFFTATFLLLRNGSMFLAGTVFGLVALKPQLGLAVGLGMLLIGNWRFVLGATLTSGILVAIAHWSNEFWLGQYLNALSEMGNYTSISGYQTHESQSLWGGLTHLLPESMDQTVKWLTAGISVVMVLLVARFFQGMNGGDRKFPFQFSILMLVTVLISPHFYSYDLTILYLPLLLIFSESKLVLRLEHIQFQPDGHDIADSEAGDLRSLHWNQGLALALFCLAGFLPTLNQKSGFPCSILLISALMLALAWHIRMMTLEEARERGHLVRSSTN